MASHGSASANLGVVQQHTQTQTRLERHRAWFVAAENGDVAALARLLAVEPTVIDVAVRLQNDVSFVLSALQICVWREHRAAVAWLLDVGRANIELQDDHGLTALLLDLLRVRVQQMRTSPLLRSSCIDVTSSVEMAIYRRKAAKDRSAHAAIDTSIFELLLARGANVNHCSRIGETALLLAVGDGLLKHVRLLLGKRADVHHRDAHGRSLLEVATESGFTDVATELIAYAPDLVESSGEQAMREAVRSDFVDTMEMLLPRVTEPLADDARLLLCGRLLHLAVEFNARQSAQYLLASGVPIDWRDPDGGHTALHVACEQRRAGLLVFLLESGADKRARRADRDGFSLFHIAIQHHGFDQIDVLARHGADINLCDRSDRTPLLFAASSGCGFDIMDQLVSHGAHFGFPTSASRDQAAPILVLWLHTVDPQTVSSLVEVILNSRDCVLHERQRRVISALVWTGYSKEALLLVLLSLLSPRRRPALMALSIIMPWAVRHRAHRVVCKLLSEALAWSDGSRHIVA